MFKKSKKMKHFRSSFTLLAVLISASATFMSCGDDNDTPDTGGIPDTPVTPVTPSEDNAMTPEDQKEYLETIAKELMDKMPASDFSEIASLGKHIADTYVEDYDWDNVGDWGEDIFNGLRKSLGTTSTVNNYTDSYEDWQGFEHTYISNSIYADYTAVLTASNFTGHFTASNGKWVLTKATDLQFIFNDKDGKECVLKLETSGNVKKVYAFNIDKYTDYDSEQNGNTFISNDYYDRTQCTIGVPENIVITLTQGGRQMMKTTININLNSLSGENFDISKNSFTASLATELGNGYKLNTSQVAYTANSKASISFVMTKNGENIITIASAADVHDIPSCNISAFTANFDIDDYNTDKTNAQNAYVKLDIIGKMQIQGTVSDVRKFAEALDNAHKYNDNESKYKSYINSANGLLDVALFYDGQAVKQAGVTLEPFEEEKWYGGKYWTADPVLNFYDGSSYSTFESFFNETDFKGTIDAFKALADKYAALVDERISW